MEPTQQPRTVAAPRPARRPTWRPSARSRAPAGLRLQRQRLQLVGARLRRGLPVRQSGLLHYRSSYLPAQSYFQPEVYPRAFLWGGGRPPPTIEVQRQAKRRAKPWRVFAPPAPSGQGFTLLSGLCMKNDNDERNSGINRKEEKRRTIPYNS